MKKDKLEDQEFDESNNLINRNFDEILSEGFNRYAKYIIQDRALPELNDGLKPVQRRILYAMYKLNLLPTSQFKKSARTVGDVLGKYHPHGDTSIYEALIRMAQDWKNNIPQIEIHGNKGSIDDDPPAAMRYTEARLSIFGKEMLSDIEKKIYPFINNFDDTEAEPTILSTLLPNLLINGASGIAAGYATSIPTFNIKELLNLIIEFIKNPNLEFKDIIKIMPGPDFPTGGVILNQQEIKNCYIQGEGKITIRSSYDLEEDKKGNKKIIIKSIPYETIKSNIVRQIEELRANNKLYGVTNVIDASDKHGIAIEVEIINSLTQENIDSIMSFLYKKTELQINFNANMIVINNRKPIKIGVVDYIKLYLKHAYFCIIKTHEFLLKQDEDRYEIVIGLIKAIGILDEIISIIRSSQDKQDSINNLIKRFDFTFKQAEAIVLLRLYRLSNTDIAILKKEKDDLSKNIDYHKLVITQKEEQDKYLIQQLENYLIVFKDFNRKSKILKQDKLDVLSTNEKDLLLSKKVYVIISDKNQIKYLPKLENDDTKFNKINFKNNDDYISFILESNIKNTIIFFTNLGRVISIDTFKIQEAKWRDNGEDLNNKLHLLSNEKIIQCFDNNNLKDHPSDFLLFTTKLGKMKRVDKNTFLSDKEIRLTSCINLDNNDELVSVTQNNLSDLIFSITKKGNVTKFEAILIPLVSNKAKGVNGVKVSKNDEVIRSISFNQDEIKEINLFSKDSYKNLILENIKKTKRNVEGTNVLPKKTSHIINAFIPSNSFNYYGYNINYEYVNMDNLSIKNTNNWSALGQDLLFVSQIYKN